MGKEKIEVFVTKYLFTKGIQNRTVFKPNNNGTAYDAEDDWFWYGEKDWYLTWEGALKRAQELKAKKLKSIKKQLKKVQDLTFNQGAV